GRTATRASRSRAWPRSRTWAPRSPSPTSCRATWPCGTATRPCTSATTSWSRPATPSPSRACAPTTSVWPSRASTARPADEAGTAGGPVGLARPDGLLDRAPQDVARAVLRTLTVPASDARDLLERLADDESADDGWGGGRHGTAEP